VAPNTHERNRVLAGERISRAQIDAAGEPTLDDIEAAIAAWDHERAAMLALARARTQPVSVELVSRILPGLELPAIATALIAVATGDKAELLAVVTERRFPTTKEAADLEAIVLYAAWKAGATNHVPEVRRLAMRSLTAEAYALLATIGTTITDENTTIALKPIATFAKEYAKSVAADDKAMTATVEATLASLPAEVELSRGGFTVRAQKQPGRNDPCSCGSGQKYKKCCADKPVAAASPIPGLSWDEFLAGDKLTSEHVDELAITDLLKVDFAKLDTKPLVAATRKLVNAHAWDHAERAIDESVRRDLRDTTGVSWADDLRTWLIERAIDCGPAQRARVDKHIALLSPEEHARYELGIEVARGPSEAWTALVAHAKAAVSSKDMLDDVELAYSLLRAEPVVGIYFARACIGTLHVDDADMLLDAVEEARDHLMLAPVDPAWEVLDELTAKDKKRKKPTDDGALKTQLAESTARADQLERSLAALRNELASERTKPAAELVRQEKATELDGRIEELEGLIREGQAERRDLRKQLEVAAEKKPEEPRRRVVDEAPDDGDGVDDLPVAARGITLPRFDRKFTDSIADVPGPVASEAMRTIGTLSAGDGFAWRSVKQAKDMVRPLLMARVGIHHRLLFRCDDGILDVMDLITRETLLTTLKRIRGAR
jgi:hypothetical protein